MKVLPWPGVLATVISPPSSPASSRLIDRPRPVPPYRRAVVPSPWAKASKIRWLLLVVDADAGVADGDGDDRRGGDERLRLLGSTRRSVSPIRTCTSPRSVNLKALASRFLRIWRRRWGSVTMVSGDPGARSIE